MDSETTHFIDVTGATGRLAFTSPQELHDWAQSEMQFWAWINERAARQLPIVDDPTNDINRYIDAVANGARMLMRDANGPEASGTTNSIRSNLNQYIALGFQSVTPRSAFFSRLCAAEGARVALAGLIHTLGGALQEHGMNRDMRLAVVNGRRAADAFASGLEHALPETLSSSIGTMVQTYNSAVSEAKDALAKITSEFEAEKAKSRDEAAVLRTKVETEWEAKRSEVDEAAKEKCDALDNMRKAYLEHMHLNAAVDYWTKKAQKHSEGAKRVGKRLACAAGLSMLLLAVGLAFLASYGLDLAKQKDLSPTAPLFPLGAGIVLTTAMTWLIRIFVRLYLSEHHLAIDAEERVTMVKTYLALTNEAKIEKEDRQLVLAPLFRPSSDGIVKDDAAPELGIGSVVSKALAK